VPGLDPEFHSRDVLARRLGERVSRHKQQSPRGVGLCPRDGVSSSSPVQQTVAWYVATQTGWMERAIAQIPGGTLDPGAVTKYVTPMLIPPVMPRAATITMPGGKPGDYYEISMKQISQQILPAGMPATTVWGYGAVKSASSRGLLIHNAPSLTIESTWKRPVRIKWIHGTIHAEWNQRCRSTHAGSHVEREIVGRATVSPAPGRPKPSTAGPLGLLRHNRGERPRSRAVR
jgi:hypothetical protein